MTQSPTTSREESPTSIGVTSVSPRSTFTTARSLELSEPRTVPS